MGRVELRFSALPAHVRTVRLVAASIARHGGVDESLLDEVRLAVGEACSRAVAVHRRAGVAVPVTVVLLDQPDRFTIEVTDSVMAVTPEGPLEAFGTNGFDEDADIAYSRLGLELIKGLVDDVEVQGEQTGSRVRMSWPVATP